MDLQDDEEEPVIMEVDIDAKKSAYIVLLCPSHGTDTTVLIHTFTCVLLLVNIRVIRIFNVHV